MATDKRAVALAMAVALAVPAEGLRTWAYDDIADPKLLTVCYGHTGADVTRTRSYSLDECKSLLDKDMLYAISVVEQCRAGLPPAVLAAFSDAVFNMGPTIACNTGKSTAARMLAAGDFVAACRQLPRWSRASFAGVSIELPGLVKRRAAEMAVCLHGAI